MMSENVITIVASILGSGLIGMLLQRYWKLVDDKKAEQREQSEEARQEREVRERDSRMLKKIFRANLNRSINGVREQIDDPNVSDSQLRLNLQDLHDDMEDYFDMGGNGGTHTAYVALYKEIAAKKPELITVAWLDCLEGDID